MHLALGWDAEPLSIGSREKVTRVLGAIVDVLDAVSQHYTNSSNAFPLGGHGGGAYGLLHVIYDGLRVEAGRRDRLDRGEWRSEDDYNRDL
jgi:hypothetical protein